MRRIAHVMSHDGSQQHNDGGIWQVSAYAFEDTQDTNTHIRLGKKYEKIEQFFGIKWKTVELVDLAIPIYSAIAARLYLSNFAHFVPPRHEVKKQAEYWWETYMKNHESKKLIKCQTFINTVEKLESGVVLTIPTPEERIWISGEAGVDVVNDCIKKIYRSGIIAINIEFMCRVAHVMSNYGDPSCPLLTDGGIWQVSLFAFGETQNIKTHLCLKEKFKKIHEVFKIDWMKVERNSLGIPIYSAIAAALYMCTHAPESLSNIEDQADYWWNIYMKEHESKRNMQRSHFIYSAQQIKSFEEPPDNTEEEKKLLSKHGTIPLGWVMWLTVIITFLVVIGSLIFSYKSPSINGSQLHYDNKPSLEERIWISGEAGEDVVSLCVQKVQESKIFPDDHKLMRRIAHVMSNDGKPPFSLHTDGGIWQVSIFALKDTHDTDSHISLGTKYGKIKKIFDIDWRQVGRVHLAIPMYSAIAARLYLSNFAEYIPPDYSVNEQADYWWNYYMKNHESKNLMSHSEFTDTVFVLNKQNFVMPPQENKESSKNLLAKTISLTPTISSQKKLDISHLLDVQEKLRSIYFPHSSWMELCLSLGLYKHTLDTISYNFPRDASRCLTECIGKWLKEQDAVSSRGGPYWSSLKRALNQIGENASAEKL